MSKVIEPYSYNQASKFFGFGADMIEQDSSVVADITENMEGLNLEDVFPINLDKWSSDSTGIDELL